MTQEQLFLKLILARRWKNGHLKFITERVQAGIPLDRERDTDFNIKDWQEFLTTNK